MSHVSANAAAAAAATPADTMPAGVTAPPPASSTSVSPVDLDVSDRSLAGCHRALLALQSKTIEALTQSVLSRHLVTRQMRSYLQRLQLDVDRMNVIHIAGTKGKGSTGAFTERICREQGLTTALYTSPHLVDITERFRLNGTPVSTELFLRHFWLVWDGLCATKHLAGDNPPIPSYFRYLTLVAYHLFLTHATDVVILEVGMGGKLDATNIVHRPVACGIASIGYDHMEILGYTLTEIAHEKAGIIKPDVPVYSIAGQDEEVKVVLREVSAAEKAGPLTFVPSLPEHIELGLAGRHQYENAGLACALAHEFLRHRDPAAWSASLNPDSLPPSFLSALRQTSWPGRCQRLAHPSPQLRDRVTFYIDGAHTDASMAIACRWLQSIDQDRTTSAPNETRQNVLLFNCGHTRDPIELMIPLAALAYPADSASSSSSPPPPPIRFSRVLCTKFDHDRPHLSSAPSFERLLQNYLLTHQRRSNASVAAGHAESDDEPPTINPHIHDVLLRYLTKRFDFPSSATADGAAVVAGVHSTIAAVVSHHSVAAAGVAAFPPAAASVTGTWQHTLFQVWHFLTAAFQDATNSTAEPASLCYASSVHDAIECIESVAAQEPTPITVFVTGSLYIVGNVLQKLEYRV